MGVFLPCTTFETNNHSNLLVGILITEIICFNTKKRVPYKIVFEFIDPEELKYKTFFFKEDDQHKISKAKQDLLNDFLE